MPREWPPVSVWLLAGVQLMPVAGVLALMTSDDRERPGLCCLCPGLLLGPTAVLSGLLGVFGRDTGDKAGGWGLAALAAAFWLTAGAVFAWMFEPAAAGPPLGFGVTTAALLWWPATRRWCGIRL